MKNPGALLWVVPWLFLAPLLQAQEQQQPQLHEEVTVRWWLVPVYAIDKAGAPVSNLAPGDLDVSIKGIKVEPFSLIKKQFQVTEAKNTVGTAPQPSAPAQKKMVFLVFDAAFSAYNLLGKAKAIAEKVIAQSDKSAQYVLLSIEPLAGLRYVAGPTQDLKLISQAMKEFIYGKQQEHLLVLSDVNRGNINDAYPRGDPRHNTPGMAGGDIRRNRNEGQGWQDRRRIAGSFTSALLTLNLVLGYFKDYSKVVYLYSCGIPNGALTDRSANPIAGGAYYSADFLTYDRLKTIGEYFNKSGALLFLVNPAGTWIGESVEDSGEQSLRILARESGGRYFEGAEKEISREVNNMEGGYYEISFPDKPEYAGQELSFEIRSTKPDVQIFTVRKVGREKSYADMTELEQDVLVLYILNKGPYAEVFQKVSYVEGQAFRDGDTLVCQLNLPPELARSEWSVFKVRRDFETGEIQIDREQVISDSPKREVRMAWKDKRFRHDLVLAHAKTGTILVWK